MDLQVPLSDDYWGIRRSFWSITDNVYRNAARHYQKHQQTLAESGKDLKDIPHRSFAKGQPMTLITNGKSYLWDKAYWETFAREVSALFVNHPAINNSGVRINFIEGDRYMVNTEGTKFKIPFSLATFTCFGQLKTVEGEFGYEHITQQFATPDGFKDKSKMVKDVQEMIKRLESHASIAKIDDDYTGPVLVTGEAVAELFMSTLLRGPENIMLNDNIRKLTGYQFNVNAQFESKIGKPVTHESLTIKARPKMNSYNGVDLLGSFPIDGEGIVPPDEEVVIEKGILRSLLNNRTLTSPSQRANGFSSGPGVIEVTSSMKDSEKGLREQLIAKAKASGLEYGIMIRGGALMGQGFMTVNRIWVADGREELVRHAFIRPITLKTFREIAGVSSTYAAYNLSGAGPAAAIQNPSAMVSFIVPDQILFDELEIQPMRLPILSEEDVVSNPLK